ncbi:MAG: DUF2142 domain-containing protein, partial [Methanobrevibacter sp.]|nr:DUF2142 domain-containing protein [Candidatus Methanovirga procula]
MTNLIKMKIEVIFLVFALIFGSMFAVINPPFISLDEGAHFVKAFDVSQGHIIPSNGPTIDIPKSIFSIPGIRGLNNNLVYSISDSKKFDYIPYLKIPFNIKDTIEIGQRNTNVYMPLPYLATALVIKIGEFFNISPLVLLYFGRLINLLFYIVVVYFAIKIVPIGKYIFLLLALMPM